MSLEKLAQIGWYKAEPSSSKEVSDLFSLVDRSQADLKVEGISDDLRFQAAYNGILTLANIALRASGFRVSLGQAHHQRVIESLEYTLTTQDASAREKWVRKIKSHSQKRNTTSYDLAGGVSPTDLAQAIKDLTAFKRASKCVAEGSPPGASRGRFQAKLALIFFPQLKIMILSILGLVEAAGVEPASEIIVSRENPCSVRFRMFSPHALRTDKMRVKLVRLISLFAARTEPLEPAY